MRVIKSIDTNDTILTSSNIAENEYAAWASATSYAANAGVIYNHKIYTAISAHTSSALNTPELDATKWLYVSYTNRYRMFDNVISNSSSKLGGITFTLKPSQTVDSMVFLDLNAASVQVVMTDPVFGEVYNKTQILSDTASAVDYYAYFTAYRDWETDRKSVV